MTTVHKNLTGADLHEPKGADTALNGQVYVSDGAGSGVWTSATSILTNNSWDTGDVKPTLRATASTGWILWNVGTIGDGSSGGTIRANTDTSPLFTLLYNNYDDSLCPVSGGRGVSASADFSAHKTISLPAGPGRVLGISGSGTGLTVRGFGVPVGTETYTVITANLPAYTPTGSVATTISGSITIPVANLTSVGGATDVNKLSLKNNANADAGLYSAAAFSGTGASAFTGTAQGGTSTPFSLMQPTIFQNFMIKL